MATTTETRVSLADEATETSMGLTSLAERIRAAKLTLEKRVELYGEINPLKKTAEKLREELRNEIVDEVKSLCKTDPSGKLALKKKSPLISETAKGALVLKHPTGALELRPKAKETFDADKAVKVLREKDLLQQCQVTTTTHSNFKALSEAIESTLCTLDDLSQESPLLRSALMELSEAFYGNLTTTTTLSEEKIKALVVTETLSVDDVVDMFSTTYTYSLYEKE